jgi:hypothetical protein
MEKFMLDLYISFDGEEHWYYRVNLFYVFYNCAYMYFVMHFWSSFTFDLCDCYYTNFVCLKITC